ncbi:MAG: DUF929 family protein [Actinomycetota bacterium]|nr:DUF929 family protein [Actinomycetota bacterium]
MSQARKDDDQRERGNRPVPPRAGKGKGGSRPGRAGGSGGRSGPPPRGRQARQATQRRNRTLAYAAVAAAVVIIAVFVAIGVSGGGSSGTPRQPAPQAAVDQLNSISLTTLVDGANRISPAVDATTATGGTLTQNGKPEVLFIGAEFCPICAAERWPMTIALMKFGTFTGLKTTHSAVADGDAGTWSYYGSTYSSPYLVFTPRELYTNQPSGNYYKPLDTLTKAQQAIWQANEGSSANGLSFPFIDFGGKAVLESAQYSPTTIYNKSFSSILASVGSNDNTIGAQIDSAAAVFTKYLCSITNNQPGNVCSAVAKVNAPVTSSNTGTSTPASGG